MKVMVIGGGGREHAIVRALKKSPRIDALYALPGNGGMAADAVCAPVKASDIEGVAAFGREHGIDFAVVAPDDPLVMGMVDALEAAGIRCFGPNRAAAIIEGSKAFAKDLMQRYHIPTAAYAVFTEQAAAEDYVRRVGAPVVVKADGLALGKGVTVAQTVDEALQALRAIMEDKVFGASGSRVVIEECLTGPEVSVLAFTDGKTVVPMISSMDHKRALDEDCGPNTGGMGTIAPNPFYTPEIAARCRREIFEPTIAAMNAEGRPFKGCLYFGLMLTPDGPKVIEYNCRFGDPETQVVLPLLESDLLEIMLAVREERLAEVPVQFSSGAACCVIVASAGYPKSYETGFAITYPGELPQLSAQVFSAGTRLEDGALVTSGGRVVGVTATADTLPQAVARAYKAVEQVHFSNAYYRRDIGARALTAMEG